MFKGALRADIGCQMIKENSQRKIVVSLTVFHPQTFISYSNPEYKITTN